MKYVHNSKTRPVYTLQKFRAYNQAVQYLPLNCLSVLPLPSESLDATHSSSFHNAFIMMTDYLEVTSYKTKKSALFFVNHVILPIWVTALPNTRFLSFWCPTWRPNWNGTKPRFPQIAVIWHRFELKIVKFPYNANKLASYWFRTGGTLSQVEMNYFDIIGNRQTVKSWNQELQRIKKWSFFRFANFQEYT